MGYPITLQLDGRRCAVLGGSALAAEKARWLIAAAAQVTVFAATLSAEMRQLAASGAVQVVRRDHQWGDLAGCFLAVDASGDEAVNERSFAEAEAEGVLMNVVDRPALCHFHAPAIVRRGPLTLAISTAGESPFLAAALRARLERTVGEEWGAFTALMGGVRRRLRSRGLSLAEQNRVYRRLLRSDVRRLLADQRENDARYLTAAIETTAGQGRPGRVALVGAGPGNPQLLTVAARELLAEADVVFHDALVDPRTLALCGPTAQLVGVGKRGGRPSTDQGWIIAKLIAAARAGQDVVRLKGGDPFVFGRGGEELRELRQAGLEVVVVPGVSSALAAPAAAGIPVTMRGISTSVAVITGHETTGVPSDRLEAIAAAADTLVVLMPMANLEVICARLAATLGPGRPAALVVSATLSSQAVIRAPIGGLATVAAASELESPATLVVGEVVNAIPEEQVEELVRRAGLAPGAEEVIP
jgi:uroporphyrin-III C-methyltransferase/precorrin-2 dehydrogenase/sirohydrochlorin ferrochelatase